MSGTTTNTSGFSYSEFTPTKSRKKRNKKASQERVEPLALLRRAREELGQGNWLTQCQQLLEKCLSSAALTSPDMLCLGLGSPTASLNARLQLGFLLEMCDHLNIDITTVSVYDPVFTVEDLVLFGELQIRVLAENRNAGYVLMRPTICFMPHCDMELYENILKANWEAQKLPNLVLVANRLVDYIDSNPKHKLESRVPCLLQLAPGQQPLITYQCSSSERTDTSFTVIYDSGEFDLNLFRFSIEFDEIGVISKAEGPNNGQIGRV